MPGTSVMRFTKMDAEAVTCDLWRLDDPRRKAEYSVSCIATVVSATSIIYQINRTFVYSQQLIEYSVNYPTPQLSSYSRVVCAQEHSQHWIPSKNKSKREI